MIKVSLACLGLLLVLFPVYSMAAEGALFDQGPLYAQLEQQTNERIEYDSVPSPRAWRQVHKYAGYTTAALTVITAVSSSQESLHEAAAFATAAAALTTVVSGAVEYGDRLDLSAGLLEENNRHILVGTLGALLMVTAVAIADDGEEGSHSTLGIAGGALMGVALIDIKW